jgi:hypothetical protein
LRGDNTQNIFIRQEEEFFTVVFDVCASMLVEQNYLPRLTTGRDHDGHEPPGFGDELGMDFTGPSCENEPDVRGLLGPLGDEEGAMLFFSRLPLHDDV